MIKDLSANKIFTTGQVAKLVGVAPRTVNSWFDSGRLRGYRIPGLQDRRIPRDYLITFLKQHGMPLGVLDENYTQPVVIDDVPIDWIWNYWIWNYIEQMIRQDMEVVFSGKPLSELTESQLELRKLVDKMVSVKVNGVQTVD